MGEYFRQRVIKQAGSKPAGVSLIEVMLAVLILGTVSVSVLGMLIIALKTISENKSQAGGLAVANEIMETMRNLPYSEVGTVGGIVSGIMPQNDVVTLNKVAYTVNISVAYVDDEFDGTVAAGTDTLGNDYKRVRVAVNWDGHFGTKEVLAVTTVAPKGVETNEGGGVLRIHVIDANGAAVEQANVHIINDAVSPAINDNTLLTNVNGEFLSSVPASNGSYQIITTKAGYSTDYNCAIDPVGSGCGASTGNPNPVKPRATVIEGNLTDVTFAIDLLSTLRINTISQTNLPTEWVVNTDSSGEDQRFPTITLGTDGSYLFAWQDFRNSAARIYGQSYSGQTADWSPDLAITTSNNQNGPDIDVDSAGDIYAVWHDDRNGNQDIYMNKYDTGGTELWGGSKKINTDAGSADQFFPKIKTSATTTTSLIFTAWRDTRAGGGDSDIYLAKFDGDGNELWGNEVKVNFVSSSNFTATDTENWSFDNAPNYICDGGNCDGATDVEVTGGIAQLVPAHTCQGTPNACETFTIQASCSAQAGCGWDAGGPCEDGSCACGGITTESSCDATSSCDWQAGAEGCGGTCDCWEIQGRNNCLAVAGCEWFWFFCYPVTDCTCGSITTEPLCENAACGWEAQGGECAGSCSCNEVSTEPLCSAASCAWDASGPCEGTPNACASLESQATCQNQSGCSWTPAGGFPTDLPTVQPNSSLGVANLVSWDSFTETAAKNDGEIYYQLSDNNGQNWKHWNGSTWATAGAGDYNTASVVNANIGKFSTVQEQILFRAFLESDGSFQVQLHEIEIGYSLTSSGGAFSQNVALNVDEADSSFIAWETYTVDNFDIFLQKVTTDGAVAWGNDVRVNTDDSGDQNNPTIGISSTGDVYIAWEDSRSGSEQIYINKFDTDGTPVWANDVDVSAGNNPAQTYPRLVVDASDNVYVTWQDTRNGDNDIYIQKIDSDGNQVWEQDIRVSTSTAGDQSRPDMLINDAGNLVIAWQDNRDGNYDIRAAEFAGDPSETVAIPSVPVIVTGAKQVGTSPVIYKYQQNHTTNGSGNLILSNMEWDTYTIELQGGSGYIIVNADPPLPYALTPGSDTTINLILE